MRFFSAHEIESDSVDVQPLVVGFLSLAQSLGLFALISAFFVRSVSFPLLLMARYPEIISAIELLYVPL